MASPLLDALLVTATISCEANRRLAPVALINRRPADQRYRTRCESHRYARVATRAMTTHACVGGHPPLLDTD